MLYTDWERIKNMGQEEAYKNALNDPDNPPLTDANMAKAVRASYIPGENVSEKLVNLKKKRM